MGIQPTVMHDACDEHSDDERGCDVNVKMPLMIKMINDKQREKNDT